MRLVDTHAHTWGTDTDELPWYSAELPPGWSGPYTHRTLIDRMDAAGVDESVLLPTAIYGRGERANEYTVRALEAHPDRLWGVGVLDYLGPGLRERARRLLSVEGMLGVRFHACFEYGETPGPMDRDAEWIADDALDPLYEELGARGVAAFVLAKPEQFGLIGQLADANPDVQFVLEHMGWPDEGTSADDAPWTDIRSLSARENVLVKVSSVPRAAGDAFPYEAVAGYVTSLLEWFGADRLLLGSDYPWLDEMATYEDCLVWPERADFLSAREFAWLSHRTFDQRLAEE